MLTKILFKVTLLLNHLKLPDILNNIIFHLNIFNVPISTSIKNITISIPVIQIFIFEIENIYSITAKPKAIITF